MTDRITDDEALASYKRSSRASLIWTCLALGISCAFIPPVFVLGICLFMGFFFKFMSIIVPDARDSSKISKHQLLQNANRYR